MDLTLGNLQASVASTQHPSTLVTVSPQFPRVLVKDQEYIVQTQKKKKMVPGLKRL